MQFHRFFYPPVSPDCNIVLIPPTLAKIDFPEEYVEFLGDPWQQERGEMTLLTCARKHRTMLWQRYNRTLMRRNALALRKKASVAASNGIATSAMTKQSAASTASVVKKGLLLTSASIPIEKAASNQDEVTPESEFTSSPSPTESTSPWRALFLAFFAIIQPETMNERVEPENDFLDDLRVLSVPPHVSDVVSDASDLFWRYDMDSYAANNHNEDRSQYILDRLSLTADADNNAEPENSSVFFCGCYDGHGGEQAVEYVQRNLYRNIKRHLIDGETVTDAIVSGFQYTDRDFNRRSVMEFAQGSWSACSVGACAVIAMVVDTKLYVASCGDCRAIMAFREPDGSLTVEQVTLDHSANEAREQERLRILYPDDYDIVREIGAQNFYVKGRLQPTRSLGDTYMKVQEVNRAPMPRGLRIRGNFKRPYITAVPDVFEFDLNDRQPEFLVLGSDGLYGEMTNDEIASTIDSLREKGVENVSEGLREAVMERIAKYYNLSTEDLEKIAPGERRDYHDDITIDVIHFTAPSSAAEVVEAQFV